MKARSIDRVLAADDGFSLAELIIAVSVMLVVCIGVLSAVSFAATAMRNAAVKDAALSVATNQVEFARSLSFDNVGISGGTPNGTLPSTFTTTTAQGSVTVTETVDYVADTYDSTSVRYGKAPTKYLVKRLRVRVSWSAGIPGSVALDTLMTGAAVTDTKMTQ